MYIYIYIYKDFKPYIYNMSIYTYLMYLTFTGFHITGNHFLGNHVDVIFGHCTCPRRNSPTQDATEGSQKALAKVGSEQAMNGWNCGNSKHGPPPSPLPIDAVWRRWSHEDQWYRQDRQGHGWSRMVTDGHEWSRMVTNGHGSVVWNCENFRVCRKDHAGFQRQKDVMSLQLRLNACAMISLGTPAGSECTRATFWTVTLFLNILNCGRRSSGISVRSVCCSNMMLT